MIDYILYHALHLSPINELLVKVSLLLSAGWAMQSLLDRFVALPRWRVLMWRGVAIGALSLPVLIFAGPSLSIRLTKAQVEQLETRQFLLSLATEDVWSDSVESMVSPPPSDSSVAALGSNLTDDESQVAQTIPTPIATLPTDGPTQESGVGVLLLAAWLGGVLFFCLRFLLHRMLILTNVRTATPASPTIAAAAQSLATKMRVSTIPQVRVSSNVSSPYLSGFLHPVIVLSARVANAGMGKQIESVLAHEIAHIRGGDVAWSAIVELMSILIWFHPFAWKMTAAHAAACEEVADALAAEAIGGQKIYSAILARVALDVLQGPRPLRAALPMARIPEIRQRLNKLQTAGARGTIQRRSLWLAAGLFASLLTMVACTRVAKAADDTPAETVPPPVPTESDSASQASRSPLPSESGGLTYVERVAEPSTFVCVAKKEFDSEDEAARFEAQCAKEGWLVNVEQRGEKWRVVSEGETDALVAASTAQAMARSVHVDFEVLASTEFELPFHQLDLANQRIKLKTQEIENKARQLADVDPLTFQFKSDNPFPTQAYNNGSNTDVRAAVFDLKMKDDVQMDAAARTQFIAQVREVVETLLYANQSREDAEKMGIKIWYAENSNRLTITNTNSKIDIVAEYLQSLPELEKPVSNSRFRSTATLRPALKQREFERTSQHASQEAKRMSEEAVRNAQRIAREALQHVRDAGPNPPPGGVNTSDGIAAPPAPDAPSAPPAPTAP